MFTAIVTQKSVKNNKVAFVSDVNNWSLAGQQQLVKVS